MYKKYALLCLCILLSGSTSYAVSPLDISLSTDATYSANNPFDDNTDISSSEKSSVSEQETTELNVSEEIINYEHGFLLDGDVKPVATDTKVVATDTKPVATDTQVVASDTPKIEKKEEPKTTEYTVVKGDYLSKIAAEKLGDYRRWPELVELNKDRYPGLLSNPNLIYAGWVLKLPSKDVSSTETSVNTNTSTNTNNSNGNGNNGSNTNTNVKTSTKTNTSTSTNTNTNTNNRNNNSNQSGKAIITPESRVLHIGDSHSCGIYGKTIDGLMRETGATVKTTAVAGSSPNWWMNGTTGKCGYYSKDENGNVTEPHWQTPMQTPLLQNLIDTYKPSVLVVSLGANMAGNSESNIRSQIKSICDKAKAANCKLVWVGPPDERNISDSNIDKLYKVLQSEIPNYDGTLIDSRKYTKYPSSGGDGLHYTGTEGGKIAKTWANSVMGAIQGK